MVFSHLLFIYLFLPLLLLAYYIIKNDAYRRVVLVAFSLLFYAWGEPICVFLMIGLVLADYLFGLLIDNTLSRRLRKFWLVVAVAANLGILVVFKYLGFFTETANSIFSASLTVPQIVMPIGISFFTFQSMSYVIDVYRRDTDVQKSFFSLLLYVSFFPQLIAGPIVRYKDIADQLPSRKVDIAKFNDGLFRFSVGLAKKVIIADCCDTVVTALYGMSDVTVLGRWVGALFFTLQLYFDFSGYSDMAIGLGKMFGFGFRENFNYPLISKSATEFWRRWHMSLGTFFRDYVYIPLGGNRHDQYRNIMVVWFLTGMWHGASWNFILWGVYYGVLLILEKYVFGGVMEKLPNVLRHVLTLILILVGWVFFRADDLTSAVIYLSAMAGFNGGDAHEAVYLIMQYLPELIICLIGIFPVKNLLDRFLSAKAEKSGVAAFVKEFVPKLFALAVFALAYMKLVSGSFNPFIYFQF